MPDEKMFNLIKLIDDPDTEIYAAIRNEILLLGKSAINDLEKQWENHHEDIIRDRVEELIDTIHFNHLKTELRKWTQTGSKDLLFGAYLIALLEFPDLEYEEISIKLEQIKLDVWLELAPNLTALEKVKILNHILFDIHQFTGNLKNYYSPHNSYLNQVMDRKKGNPISLAIIYSVVAQKLDIPIFGVNLPKNYILAYLDVPMPLVDELDRSTYSVLFYINPFNRGAIFSKKDIDDYLKQQKIESNSAYYFPCPNIDTVYRIVHNLSFVYNQKGNMEKLRKLDELKVILKPGDFTGSI